MWVNLSGTMWGHSHWPTNAEKQLVKEFTPQEIQPIPKEVHETCNHFRFSSYFVKMVTYST